jgi:hypothetical protein
MKQYRISRNGKVLASMALEVRADGTLWSVCVKDNPVLDSKADGFKKLGKDKISALIKSKKFDEIPADCFARIGISATGLEIKSYDEIRAEAKASMTPAQIERERIRGLYARAEARLNARDDDNTSDYYRLKGIADAALEAWRKAYPREAALEKADALDTQAAHEEHLAQGAMLYDADGSISHDEQIARRDAHLAKAAELRKQAAELRK